MWPAPVGYADVVRASNGLRITADVFRAGVRIYAGLPIAGGSIRVDAQSATRRRLDLTIPPFLRTGAYASLPSLPDPADATAPLGSRGHEIRVSHSLITSDGRPLTVPVGRFRIDKVAGSDLGRTAVRVLGVSREAYVVDDIFTYPRTVSGPSATALIASLIRASLPQAQVIVTASRDVPVRAMTEDSDRWGLILTLAKSIGAQVYADPEGAFVIADAPTVDTPAVWRFQAGEDGRSLLDSRRIESRVGVANLVSVQGATPEGATMPVIGIARDDAPDSPTRFGDPDAGAYGRVSVVVRQPSLTQVGQCRAVAAAELAKRTGAAAGLDLAAVPNAALEALDVVDVVVPTSTSGYTQTVRRHVVDEFTLPLTPGGDFPVATRDIRAAT